MFFIISIVIIFIILLIILGKSFNKKKIVQSYSVQSFLQGSNHDDEDIYKEESMFEKVNHFFESNKESSDSGDDGDDSCDE
ncbi:hypothetical protein [Metabacillus schmidteae]|uniref:hypothetical protein n=1 Tax=Metabacillus schmidteae TaxID=2730405 RepID=UPI001589E620|nr:hypothetical protein [Metabacillus schmidteae]